MDSAVAIDDRPRSRFDRVTVPEDFESHQRYLRLIKASRSRGRAPQPPPGILVAFAVFMASIWIASWVLA